MPRTVHTVQLARHDTVVLYSDGLIESRNEDIDDGLGRLHDSSAVIVDAHIRDVAELLARRLAGADHGDDVTVLALRIS